MKKQAYQKHLFYSAAVLSAFLPLLSLAVPVGAEETENSSSSAPVTVEMCIRDRSLGGDCWRD